MDCRSGGLRFRETVTPAASAMLVRKHTNTHYTYDVAVVSFHEGSDGAPPDPTVIVNLARRTPGGQPGDVIPLSPDNPCSSFEVWRSSEDGNYDATRAKTISLWFLNQVAHNGPWSER